MPIRSQIPKSAKWIGEQLANSGFEAYIVGGAVRDLILGIRPKDFDIVTSARPDQIKKIFGRQARIIGRRFRLVHVYIGKEIFEVSTFRREPTVEECCERQGDDGIIHWRDNQYGSMIEDAFRRDFTVNSIYYDIVNGSGLVDHVNGVEHLEQKVVHAIGDANRRIEEDPVRALRAVKLVGQYGFTLSKETAAAVRKKAERISLCSRTRLFEELIKIFCKPYAFNTLSAMHEFGLLEHFWPTLYKKWDTDCGRNTMQLIKLRDEWIKNDLEDFSKSKTLIISTCALATVADEFCDGNKELWTAQVGLERNIRGCIVDLFLAFPVPRFLTARARDVIALLPRLLREEQNARLLRHSEYKYARELFFHWVDLNGMGDELKAKWPVSNYKKPPRRRRPNRSRN